MARPAGAFSGRPDGSEGSGGVHARVAKIASECGAILVHRVVPEVREVRYRPGRLGLPLVARSEESGRVTVRALRERWLYESIPMTACACARAVPMA